MRQSLLVLLLAACGGGLEDPYQELPADPSFPGTPGEASQYESLFRYDDLAECIPSNAMNLGLGTELRVFRGEGVSDDQLHRHLAGLARYYGHYGVTMFTRYEVIDVPLSYALVLDSDAINARVKEKTGLSPNDSVPPGRMDELLDAVGDAVFYNIRQLIATYGSPANNYIDVVILKGITGGKIDPEFEDLKGIAGLGLSPYLLASVSDRDASASLYKLLGLMGDFTPIAIIGADLVDQYLKYPDIVLSHEVGHAYGLVHTVDAGNLMTQGLAECFVALDAQQLDRVEEATAGVSYAVRPGPEQLSLEGRASDVVATLARRWPALRR